jgi:hypothetical protein
MNRVTNWLRTVGLRAMVAAIFIALTALSIPTVSLSQMSAQASSMKSQTSSDKGMIQKIQKDAEDLGDSPDRPIGKTGLKNIKNLGENIKETVDLNVRQKGAIYNPKESDKIGALKEAQKKAEKAAK